MAILVFFSIEWPGIGVLSQMSTMDFFVKCKVFPQGHLKDKNVSGLVINAFSLFFNHLAKQVKLMYFKDFSTHSSSMSACQALIVSHGILRASFLGYYKAMKKKLAHIQVLRGPFSWNKNHLIYGIIKLSQFLLKNSFSL